MARLPLVAIIGRPNTGKSTLFNRLIGRRKAIVSALPGTTRDHVSERIEGEEVDYMLIDTGGMGATDDTDFESDVFAQSLLALEHADVILFTLNGREELTSDDHRIIDLLQKKRQRHVPVIVVLTKVDTPTGRDETLSNFADLPIGEATLAVSATHYLGIEELKQLIVTELKKLHFRKESQAAGAAPTVPRIAIIGRPNVGKSSIINAFMSEAQRRASPLLVSEIPGTTRDTTDTRVRYEGKEYLLIDTAGLKKHARTVGEIEQYAMLRTVQAMERADVTVLVLDAKDPISQQDKRIASMAVEKGKGLILLLNKSDLLTAEQKKAKRDEVLAHLQFCRFAQVLLGSAKTKQNLLKLFDLAEMVFRSRSRHISTRELRDWFERVIYGQPLGEITKSKHITQADEIPPTFVVFVKNPKKVSASQLKYLENRLRETFGFEGTPVRWIAKSSVREK